MPHSAVTAEHSPIPRAEWMWLAGALILGAILRLSFPGRMAIEHFDEGVYASNFWFDEGEYPARYLYAPPLLPAVIEWTMIIASLCGIRPTGFIPMIPCLIAGMATIPSMWWIGRRWFGPTAGIVSAWMVALSDYHSSYSRAALTDVPVCLFILWGVYFGWQALQTGTRRAILLASLFTALAWWTKYNGWLPLAIVSAAAMGWQWSLPKQERRLQTTAVRFLTIAGLSFLFWCPVLVGLQKHGGYNVVSANHRQYVGGFNSWPIAAVEQLDHVGLYENWVPIVDSAILLRLTASRELFSERFLHLAVALVLLLAAIAGCVFWSIRHWRSPCNHAGWIVFAWICGLSAATPFYHPYPRLVLPWLMGVWLGLGMAAQWRKILPGTAPASAAQARRRQWFEASIAMWLILCLVIRSHAGDPVTWQDRSGLSRTVELFAARIKAQTKADGFPPEESVVYVYGSPASVFALKSNGLPLVGPVQGFDFLKSPRQRPTFLVRSETRKKNPDLAAMMDSHSNDFEEVSLEVFQRSHLVSLDELDPTGASNYGVFWIGRVR